MEKNVSLPSFLNSCLQDIRRLLRQVVQVMCIPFTLLRRYYGTVLDKEISTRQTWQLLNVQAAFVLAGFPMESPVLIRLACIAWFVQALRVCRRSLA
ncbi:MULTISPECIES: hypothetical protein [Prevotella]|nr:MULTISPECIES: hypothetical protein [Prevotella]